MQTVAQAPPCTGAPLRRWFRRFRKSSRSRSIAVTSKSAAVYQKRFYEDSDDARTLARWLELVLELLSRLASQWPEHEAIAAPEREAVTYRRLLDQVTSLVDHLHRCGIGRNDRVAVVLPNGPEMAIAFLAVAAGATCAPLNPAYRAEEFGFYLATSAPRR